MTISMYYWHKHFNHIWVRVPPEIVVWIYDTYDNNFEIVNDFTKYLLESCT